MSCEHSWKYHSDITRECTECGLFQRHIWINITSSKRNTSAKCKVCKKKFPSKIIAEEHLDEVHRV